MQVGIDLGTTYTAAAVSGGGRSEARIVALGARSLAVPSVVFAEPTGAFLYGEVAAQAGRADPVGLAREFKRRIGDPTPIQLRGTPLSAEALSAQLLRWTLDTVAEREGGVPDTVVLTHPANWGPFRLEMLDEIARQAGIARYERCTEPEAAAIWYAAQTRVDDGSVVAVYDLGGGTFDTAVLRKVGERFEVLGRPEGVDKLGGIDFDDAVLGYVRDMAGPAFAGLDPLDPEVRRGLAQLRADCVEAKEQLSTRAEVTIGVAIADRRAKVLLDRATYEARVEPLVDLTVRALARTIESAGLAPEHLRSVLLVGGASRAPLVERLVAEELGRPVALDVHPKEAVALGAARLASLLAGDTASSARSAPAAPVPSAPPIQAPLPPPPPPTEPPKVPAPPPTEPARPSVPATPAEPPPAVEPPAGPPEPSDQPRASAPNAYVPPGRSSSDAPRWLPSLVIVALLGAAAGGVGLLLAKRSNDSDPTSNQTTNTTVASAFPTAVTAQMDKWISFLDVQVEALNDATDLSVACRATLADLRETYGDVGPNGFPEGLIPLRQGLDARALGTAFSNAVVLRIDTWTSCANGRPDCLQLAELAQVQGDFFRDYGTALGTTVARKVEAPDCTEASDPQSTGTT